MNKDVVNVGSLMVNIWLLIHPFVKYIVITIAFIDISIYSDNRYIVGSALFTLLHSSR